MEEVVLVVGAEQVPGADVGGGPGVRQGAVGGQGAGDQVPLRDLPGGGGFRPSAAVLAMPKKFLFYPLKKEIKHETHILVLIEFSSNNIDYCFASVC